MEILRTVAEVRAWRARTLPAGALGAGALGAGDLDAAGRAGMGLVPTMGYLHAGHLSLIERARADCAWVAASIFVNPAQFDSTQDLSAYPRDTERDLALLEAAGCDALFLPEPAEMYPPGFQTWVEPGGVAAPLEGAHRPGHFRGVATVVAKLFGIFGPTRAYFGQKDFQQLQVVRTLVRDLNLPVAIVGCPTLREPDGLAMSSRNARLGPAERAAAPALYRALEAARAAWSGGERSGPVLRQRMRSVLEAEPLARVDYLSVADPATLDELDAVPGPALLSLAVRIGPVRLIDNLLLPAPGEDPGSGSRA